MKKINSNKKLSREVANLKVNEKIIEGKRQRKQTNSKEKSISSENENVSI